MRASPAASASGGPGTKVVAVGAAVLPGDEILLGPGDRHPSAHGGLRLRLVLDGDRIVAAEPVVGYQHRGAEKLFEVRDYRQIVMLANRHDWLSAFSSELGVVLAVERMLGMEVPARATWLRTLLAELNRLLTHLSLVGAYADALGRPGTHLTTGVRQRLQMLMEECTGGRVHYMFNRVGGLRLDIPEGWRQRVGAVLRELDPVPDRLRSVVLEDPGFVARTRGRGTLSAELVDAYGVSGPAAQASAVDLDLRRDDPYLAYDELLADGVLNVPTRTDGDCHARCAQLIDHVGLSVSLARACLDRLASPGTGPTSVRLPKILRPPEGSTYVWTENPLGINGYFLVSRGEKTPWRMKMRTASFGNVSVLPALLVGASVEDLLPILLSMCYVVGDLDR